MFQMFGGARKSCNNFAGLHTPEREKALCLDESGGQQWSKHHGGQAGAVVSLQEQVQLAPAWYSTLALRPE